MSIPVMLQVQLDMVLEVPMLQFRERRVGREFYRVWLIDFSKWRDLFGHPKVDKKLGWRVGSSS